MSTLQMEFMKTIEGLSDDTMRILLEVVKEVVHPLDRKESASDSSERQSKPRRMGSLKGQRLISEGYDILKATMKSQKCLEWNENEIPYHDSLLPACNEECIIYV